MTDDTPTPTYLSGQLLVAMPRMSDGRFARTVIYVCVHTKDGAMGIVINRMLGSLTFKQLLEQLDIKSHGLAEELRVHYGGPVETSKGFVLHSTDKLEEGSVLIDDDVALTPTTDILRAIAAGSGPRHSLLALGYAGWGPGQLDSELQENVWLNVDADNALLFDRDIETKWHRAIAKIGIDVNKLSGEAGHA